MENSPKVTIITVLVVLLLGIGGAYILNTHKNPFEAPKQPTPLPMSPELPQKFEDFLNEFLKNVNTAMLDYKKERKALIETVSAVNLRDPAYIEENYKMAQELIPSLRTRIDGVVKLFEDAEKGIDGLLVNQPEEARQKIMGQWDKLKQTQGNMYIEYFTFESDLLGAYDQLVTFYYNHRMEMQADLDRREVVFKDQNLKAQEEMLKQHIKDLSQAQSAALDKYSAP